ncbi:prolyl oligopeptidase family serine peptidase [Pseudoduganella sp. FT26W]|uniref:Prolyl oligopeptidase family serine peptidase n=1 Tax=Duganella aquatilis TaxID=2666082 RepID=A0A844DE75_9BURK|nr:prolyl oligopeptidase family serine peptidase [Duganella aquatilis]MRW86149.1 prolyl oligopeptidase family serine peptidase [Duganella aquatilis]
MRTRHLLRHLLRVLAVAGASILSPASGAEAVKTLPPIADFFNNPELSGAVLSPSGKYLAVRIANKNNPHDMLGVVDLATSAIKVVGNFNDADIGDYQWISDARLAFSASDRDLAQGDMRYAPGLFAINRDGTAFRQLAMRDGAPFVADASSLGARELLPWHTYLMDQDGAQDSDEIYVEDRIFAGNGDYLYTDVLRLNTMNGRVSTPLSRPGDSVDWLLDHAGQPRLTTTQDKGGGGSVYYREQDGKDWRKLTGFERYTGDGGAFRPLAFGPDGTLYVISPMPGKDTTALFTYNVASGKLSERPLVALDGYDFRGGLIISNNKLLGINHLTDAMSTTWFDPGMKAMQDKVDKLLPYTVNLLTPPARPQAPWVLVTAFSDTWPKRLMLYNSETGKLSLVGASHPNIRPERMARKQLVHYKSRDGMTIPAWLTLPQGPGKNLPMVVLVHGGPWVRGGQWEWDADAQFLASRGYAVLEPEYRGSVGYGATLYRAGWKQWGLKMQDDIADGARWAIAQGHADARRICIAGASYGGYATLMGLIKDADLYQCGVEWVGVSDINLMYTGTWSYDSDFTDDYKRYGMPVLIGDQEKDAEQLKATSPLLRARELKQPLLMAYGGADMRVPLPHGTRFYQAVRQANPDVEWIEYAEEGHGWKLPKNRIDFWGRVEQFLDKHIGVR